MRPVLVLTLLLPAFVAASELDTLPLGDPDLAFELGSAPAGALYDSAGEATLELEAAVERMAGAHVVLLGEGHTSLDQKLLHARLLEGLAAGGRPLVLAMEFFQRDDRDALAAWGRGELDDRALLEATGWYDRGGYRWEYYRPVMEAARRNGIPVVGVNVPREIPRTVNRSGLDALTEAQRAEIGEVTTEGSPQHRYLIARYFGDTVAMLPPGWFENMYAAQCLWDVVMARSVLAEVAEDTTVVLVVGSGHVAYGLGISRRIEQEREAAGLPPLEVVTFCPVTAPPPDPDGEPTGHPMGGGSHGPAAAEPLARFSRALADLVGVFPDDGAIEAYPTLGLRLLDDHEGPPTVSMVWPDTLAEAVGFAHGDVIVDVNGAEPADLADLRFLLAGLQWGQRAGLLVRRGDDELEIAALLFPRVDTSEEGTAPGYEVEGLQPFAPRSPVPVAEHVAPADAPVWVLVSRDGSPIRAEVHLDDVLTEVHELDGDGRVVRSLHREPLEDGAVEVRYERDGSGAVIGEVRVDRTGRPVG
ncbi:MAG TPA: ChaN family lipoprotein [Methylomirabilota bacterium]|nr:ChaN family lipoprotein [Methylomirabilota bacterium]